MTENERLETDPPATEKPAPAARKAPARLASVDLFGHSNEILIEHAGEIYRLRITRNGKLILQK